MIFTISREYHSIAFLISRKAEPMGLFARLAIAKPLSHLNPGCSSLFRGPEIQALPTILFGIVQVSFVTTRSKICCEELFQELE